MNTNTSHMKKLAVFFLLAILVASCEQEEESIYTGNELSYFLYKSSDFDYSGKVTVKELNGGGLELRIEMIGEKGGSDYYFPAHLHFGAYDSPDSPTAFLLNPINIKDLKSVTQLGALSDGRILDFESFKNLNGHIKVHLADSGPEYQIILTAGNIGSNNNEPQAFDPSKMTLCSPYY